MNDCHRKKGFSDATRRGFFWMRVLQTTAPLGLNIDEGHNY